MEFGLLFLLDSPVVYSYLGVFKQSKSFLYIMGFPPWPRELCAIDAAAEATTGHRRLIFFIFWLHILPVA